MVIGGGILWVVMTIIYAIKYKQGIKVRKKWGGIAYAGLALLVGGGMELFKPYLASISSFWVFAVVVLFIYATAKIYLFNNIEW